MCVKSKSYVDQFAVLKIPHEAKVVNQELVDLYEKDESIDS